MSRKQNSYFFDETEFVSKPLDRAIDLQDLESVSIVKGKVGGNPERQLLRVTRYFDLKKE